MKITKSDRGFFILKHELYVNPDHQTRIVSESSAIGDYEDAFDRPGSSALWVGDDHHLNREELAELIKYLQCWLDTGRLSRQ